MAGRGNGGIGLRRPVGLATVGRACAALAVAALALVVLMAPTALARPLGVRGAVHSDALPPVNTEAGCEFIAEPVHRCLHAAFPG